MEVPGKREERNVHPRSLLADLRVCHEDRAVVGASEAAAGGTRWGQRKQPEPEPEPSHGIRRGGKLKPWTSNGGALPTQLHG